MEDKNEKGLKEMTLNNNMQDKNSLINDLL